MHPRHLVFFFAAMLLSVVVVAADCRRGDVIGQMPKYASDEALAQHARVLVRGVAKDSPGPGTLRIVVQKWEKGAGLAEILVSGFPHGYTLTSCDSLRDEIEFDVPHLLVLEDVPKDGEARLFRPNHIPAGVVFRRAIPVSSN